MYSDCCYAITQNSLYTQRQSKEDMVNTFERCIRLRESQQSLISTAKGVLGGKPRALGSIHARSWFIRCTLASATCTYRVDVFSIPDRVSERPSSTTNLHFFVLSLESLL